MYRAATSGWREAICEIDLLERVWKDNAREGLGRFGVDVVGSECPTPLGLDLGWSLQGAARHMYNPAPWPLMKGNFMPQGSTMQH